MTDKEFLDSQFSEEEKEKPELEYASDYQVISPLQTSRWITDYGRFHSLNE